MPLTPSDVANKQFGRQVRGYAMDEVDGFLDEVEQELTRLLSENARLAQRPAQAAAPAPAAPPQSAAAAPAADATETQEAALRTLLMSSNGSSTLPRCLLILRPSASRMCPRQSTVSYDERSNTRVPIAISV